MGEETSEIGKWNEISQLSESSLLQKLPSSYSYDCEESDNHKNSYQQCILTTKTQTGQKLVGILTLLKSMNIIDKEKSRTTKTICTISHERRKQLVPLLALLGEQYQCQTNCYSTSPPQFQPSFLDCPKPWSSETNSKLVIEIIIALGNIFGVDTNNANATSPIEPCLSSLFLLDFNTGVSPNKTILGQLLQHYRSKLVGKEEVWNYFPAAKSSFEWILFQVKYPYLSDFIPGTLQPVLNFYDDFQIQNQLDGLDCINHIVDNVNKAELCGPGSGSWCEVIYKSLTKLLQFVKDGQIIVKLIPLLIKILKLLEKDPHNNSHQFTLYDEVLETILQTIEFGSSDEYKTKTIWLEQLCTFLEIMGNATFHWLVRIIRILHENTTCNDADRWLMVLKCVKICIANTWLKPESEKCAEIILRILYNISVFDVIDCNQQIQEEIVRNSIECFELLKCSSDYEVVRNQLLELSKSTHYVSNLNNENNNDTMLQPKFRDLWNRLSSELDLEYEKNS